MDENFSSAAVLQWYVDMGVDLAIEDVPQDRYTEVSAKKAMAAQQAFSQSSSAAPLVWVGPPREGENSIARAHRSDREALVQARTLAAGAATLDELRAALDAFDGCNSLKKSATQLVFEDGARNAQIMLVGEAPGADEDRIGRPFVGKAGQLLDRMLAAIALDRTQVYVANTVPWRPPGNRLPSPQETEACRPFIERQIALVAPKYLLCLGGQAAQTLSGSKEGITRLRGRWIKKTIAGWEVDILPTFHPSYLLRSPINKALAWRDLLNLRRKLDQNSG